MSTDTESGGSQGMGGSNGAGWIAALVGIWVLISPFFWGVTSGAGWWGGGWLFWSNIISGIVIAILAGYAVRSDNAQAGWIAALVGLWVLITPFFWGGGAIAGGAAASAGAWGGGWLFWSNIVSGIIVAILAGYAARAGSSSSASSTAA